MNRKEFKKNIPDSTSGMNGSVSSEDLEKLNNKNLDNTTNVSTFSRKNNRNGQSGVQNNLDETIEFSNSDVNKFTNNEKVTSEKADGDSVKMEEQNRPWDNKFESDRDQEGNLSRRAAKDKQKGNKALVYVLFAAIIFIMFVPVVNWSLQANGDSTNTNVTSSDKTQVADNNKTSHKKKTHKKAKKSDNTKSKSKSSHKTSDSATYGDDVDSSADTASDSSNEAATPTANTSAKTSNSGTTSNASYSNSRSNSGSTTQTSAYYTVQSGDTAYRIALNHNLTTAQLYALNGMQSGETLRTGMHLRVK